MKQILKKNGIAVALLFSSAASFVWGYSSIVTERRMLQESGVKLSKDKIQYAVMQNSRCIGDLQTHTEAAADGYNIFLSGFIQGQNRLEFKTELSFNNLGQHVGSVGNITGDVINLAIGSKGTNPIELILKGDVIGHHLNLNLPVAGPIELNEVGDSIQINYVPSQQQALMSKRESLAKIVNTDLALSLNKNPEGCKDPVILQIPEQVELFANSMEKMMMKLSENIPGDAK